MTTFYKNIRIKEVLQVTEMVAIGVEEGLKKRFVARFECAR